MKVVVEKTRKDRWSWRIEATEGRLASGYAPSEDEAKRAATQYLANPQRGHKKPHQNP